VPIARYFIFVGSTLVALLLISGWLLPNPPATFADQSVALDRAVIRIKSANKWPEKVVFDTSQLSITTPVVMDAPTIQLSSPLPFDNSPDHSNLEATGLVKPNTQPVAINHPTLQSKHRVARTARSRRIATGSVIHRRIVMSRDCCQFGWVDSGQWGDSGQTSSNAMSRGRAASSWPLD
jgi:hypothetical protein